MVCIVIKSVIKLLKLILFVFMTDSFFVLYPAVNVVITVLKLYIKTRKIRVITMTDAFKKCSFLKSVLLQVHC